MPAIPRSDSPRVGMLRCRKRLSISYSITGLHQVASWSESSLMLRDPASRIELGEFCRHSSHVCLCIFCMYECAGDCPQLCLVEAGMCELPTKCILGMVCQSFATRRGCFSVDFAFTSLLSSKGPVSFPVDGCTALAGRDAVIWPADVRQGRDQRHCSRP